MKKIKSRDKIIKMFEMSISKKTPYGFALSFSEIRNGFGLSAITKQAVAQLLNRMEKSYMIAYFGSKVSKKDAKLLLRELYDQKKWPEYSSRIYIYTPKSGKTYKRLMRRYKDGNKNKELIGWICDLYRQIEISSKFQIIYFTNDGVIKSQFKAESKDWSKEAIKQYIKNAKIDVNGFYKKRDRIVRIKFPFDKFNLLEEDKQFYEDKWQEFLKKNMFMDSYMY